MAVGVEQDLRQMIEASQFLGADLRVWGWHRPPVVPRQHLDLVQAGEVTDHI